MGSTIMNRRNSSTNNVEVHVILNNHFHFMWGTKEGMIKKMNIGYSLLP